VGDSIGGTDSVLFVTEPRGELDDKELELIKKLKQEKRKVILAINKIDMLKDKKELFDRIVYLTKFYDFDAVVPVSATRGDGMDELEDELIKTACESVHYFPDDTLTDQPERVLAAEIIREKILRLMDKEVPHGIAVAVEKMREREDKGILDIDATIYCERETHKGMIIGKHGAMLKKISTFARQDLESFFEIKVNLHTWVKVKEGWRNKEGLIHNFGLDGQD
jgi:GTP-binding protein Era